MENRGWWKTALGPTVLKNDHVFGFSTRIYFNTVSVRASLRPAFALGSPDIVS